MPLLWRGLRLSCRKRRGHAQRACCQRDLLTTRAALELKTEQVRSETEKVRSEIRNTGMRLLGWQVGIAVTGVGILGGIMAKGFGWLGF